MSMPFGVRFFLVYAFFVLALIGISLRWVIDLAMEAPLSAFGVIWMGLLAYTIFTLTLTLQRKEAARGLALGLSTLTLPVIPFLLASGLPVPGIGIAIVSAGLFHGLTRPEVRTWLWDQ